VSLSLLLVSRSASFRKAGPLLSLRPYVCNQEANRSRPIAGPLQHRVYAPFLRSHWLFRVLRRPRDTVVEAIPAARRMRPSAGSTVRDGRLTAVS
jgi:hypothetical protein